MQQDRKLCLLSHILYTNLIYKKCFNFIPIRKYLFNLFNWNIVVPALYFTNSSNVSAV